MTELTHDSAEVLRSAVQRFQDEYETAVGQPLSVRALADRLDLGTRLARWMSPNTTTDRRIPLQCIAEIAKKLRWSCDQLDALMLARLVELTASDAAIGAGVNWTIDFLKRESALSQEEEIVLDEFRKAREAYGRGLYLDAEERKLLRQGFVTVLRRAQQQYEEEAAADSTVVAPGKLQSANAKLSASQIAHKAPTRTLIDGLFRRIAGRRRRGAGP